MELNEIVRTCSEAHVADAALASIDGPFAKHFQAKAALLDRSPGMLASMMVKAFSAKASPARMAEVRSAAHGADRPVLSGLRHILSRSSMSA